MGKQSKPSQLDARIQSALADVIVETSLCAIVVTDATGCIVRVNEAFLEIFWYDREDVTGTYMVDLAPWEPGLYETTAGDTIAIGEDFFQRSREMVAALFESGKIPRFDGFGFRKDGKVIRTFENNVMICNEKGEAVAATSIIQDVTQAKYIEAERERLITDLREALSKVKKLSGMLPICASFKKIRNDKGYWNQIERYLKEYTDADFSHGICPECAKKLYPEDYDDQ